MLTAIKPPNNGINPTRSARWLCRPWGIHQHPEIALINLQLLFTNALAYSLALSLVLATIMLISAYIAPDMWVGDYPPDIKERFGPMSARASRLRPYVAVVFFLALLAVPLSGLFSLQSTFGHIPFLSALAFSSLVLLVFNLFDLLVLDWLLFCTIQPRLMVLPGTEGMAGYRDYWFHFVGFLKGLGFCTVGGLVIASIWAVIQTLVA